MDSGALNYDPAATLSGPCEYLGCTDDSACNYDPTAPALADVLTLTIEVSSGSYPSEVSWEIRGAESDSLYLTGGAPSSTSLQGIGECIQVVGFDSYGDGWNGAFLSIHSHIVVSADTVFHEQLLSFSLEGASASELVCVTAPSLCDYPELHLDCNGNCLEDVDADGVCDSVDPCVGTYDECGVCNGPGGDLDCGCEGVMDGACDCEGNVVDALGICGGDCLFDANDDGVCDLTLDQYESPCSMQESVVYQDIEYDLVEIGGRCWFADNLKATEFNDGTPLPRLDGSVGWVNGAGSGPAYCAFNGNENLSDSMGFLYNWYVANHDKNICPVGWEVPALSEEWGWSCLFGQYGSNASASLRSEMVFESSMGSTQPGLNVDGFNLLPAGYRWGNGTFEGLGWYSFFWGKEQAPQGVVANSVDFNFFSDQIEEVSGEKTDAGSIRCVKQSSNVCLLSGCMIEEACNYNPEANVHDPEICQFLDECGICGGGGVPDGYCDCEATSLDLDNNGICDVLQQSVLCIDENACNYGESADVGSGSLLIEVSAGSYPSEIQWALHGATTDSVYYTGTAPASVEIHGLPECVTVHGADVFGDGWNGAVLTVHELYVSPTDTIVGQALLSFEVETASAVSNEVCGLGVFPCQYPEENLNCDGGCVVDSDNDGICDVYDWGCNDPWANNFNSDIDQSQDSCQYQQSLLIRGVLNLPIHDDYVGAPEFYHLEALDSIPDLSEYGLVNFLGNNQTCASSYSPATLPALSLAPGAHVLVCLSSPEFEVTNASRLEEYFGDYWGAWDQVIHLGDASADDDFAPSLDNLVVVRNGGIVDVFGLLDTCWNGLPAIVPESQFEIFTECNKYAIRVSGEGGVFDANEWEMNMCASHVCNTTSSINPCGLCGDTGLPWWYPAFFEGCTDPEACNYDGCSFMSDSSCYYGADSDYDGVCDVDEVLGCINPESCNFNPDATENDGSCLDPALYNSETCECLDANLNDVCDFEEVLGCTNPTACNHNPDSSVDDGSCVFSDNQDCEGACMIAPAEGTACLNVLDFICHRNTVVASTGDIYQGHPDDIPSFFAIDSDDSLQTWGLAPLWTDWPEGQIWNVPPDATVSQLFEGMYGQVFAVDEEGNLLNQGDIGVFGMVLPALGNVVAADANEFGAVFLLSNGTVVSIGSEGMPDWNPQVPFAVALSNTIDVASVYEVHLALSDEGEIGVWGTFWNYDYYFAIPDDYLGTAVDLDGGTAAALLRTDLGEVRVWGNQQEWATQVNTFDWLANPAVHAKVDDNGVVALHEDGSMSAFSDSTSSWVDYATLLPPPSFGPVVDFDISPTGLIAKNASGQLFTKFVESHGSLTDWVNNGYDTYLSYSPFIPDVNYTHAFCVPGCTDDVAINFWPSATQDDGSCVFGGCTDDTACNFDSSAVEDDGSCTYPEIGFDCSGTCADADSDGVCDLDEVDGCVWTGACNFNPVATEDDGSCMWPAEGEDCEGACLWSSVASGECESFAGLSCEPGKLAVGPSMSCGEGSRLSGLGPDGLTFAGWHNTNLEASLVAADSNWQYVVRLGTEPLSGQLHGITDEGDIVAEPSCFGVDIPSIGEAKKLDLEGNHGVMLRQDGIVISFAPADAYDALESTPIIFNYQVEDVACGVDFNVAVDGTQNVLYWGVPHPEIQYGYLDLPYAGQFTNIDAFGLTAAGLTTLGEVLVWGEDAGGVVSEAPAAYQEAVQVVLGDGFAVMLRHDGTVEQWGQGAGSAQGMPMPPSGLSNVVELACSANQVAAYLTDGSVVHWGVTPTQAEVAGLTYSSAGSLQIATELCIPGCTNPDFVNFDDLANVDDGSCANAGCTDVLALNFAPWADTEDGSCLLFGCSDAQSCSYNPEANFALRIDTVAVHQGMVGGADLTGHVTYRLYLETPGEQDILIFMGGQDSDPMSITTTTSFYQDPLSVAIPSLPAAWLNFWASLAYDSWVTIGVTNETYNDGEPISTIASPEQDWEFVFEAGGDLVANDWVGGGWFGWPTHSNSVVGSDGEILVAQLTTDGDLNVESLFGQVWLDGDPDKATSFLFQADLHGCAYPESDFADCAGCLNDGDGDGICDEDETGGCTDQTACNFDAYATEDDGTCSYSSSDVSVVVETVANHSSGMLAGYSTYRVYAELSQPTDKVDAIYGSMSSELVVSQGEALMWQHPNMGPGVMHVSDEQLLLDPTMAFDSYVALGAGHEVPGAEVEVIGEGWTGFFEQGFPIQINDQAGGGWYLVDNGQVPNAAGEDYRVLLGQFTTQGGLSGVLNLQVEGCGGLGTFNAEGLNFSSNSTLLGCMDEEACNFSPVANTDDGNCCYDHCFQAEAVGEVEIESGVDGSILVLVPTDGQVQACLPWGCYVVRGATGVSWNGLEAQGELYGDGQLFEVGTSECLGCTQSLACNYAPLAMFDDAGCDLVVADFNGDQFVAIDDMLMLLSEFGNCTSTTCIADIDGDSDVGVNDLLLLLSAFGTGC